MLSFKITLNKPATQTFFNEAAGLRIRIQDGLVQFMPVDRLRGDDVVALDATSRRGGGRVVVEGLRAQELKDRLENEHGPFFTLHRSKDRGWVDVHPHRDGKPPSKTIAHLRIWHQDDRIFESDPLQSYEFTEDQQYLMDLPVEEYFFRLYFSAARVHHGRRRAGRPTNEAAELTDRCEETLEELRRFVRQCLPHEGEETVKAALDAFQLLGSALRHSPQARALLETSRKGIIATPAAMALPKPRRHKGAPSVALRLS